MKKIILVIAFLLITASIFAIGPQWILGTWSVDNGETWEFVSEGDNWGMVHIYDKNGTQIAWWGWSYLRAGMYAINRFGQGETFIGHQLEEDSFSFLPYADINNGFILDRN